MDHEKGAPPIEGGAPSRFAYSRVEDPAEGYLSCCVESEACAAASRATGTRKGEQDT